MNDEELCSLQERSLNTSTLKCLRRDAPHSANVTTFSGCGAPSGSVPLPRGRTYKLVGRFKKRRVFPHAFRGARRSQLSTDQVANGCWAPVFSRQGSRLATPLWSRKSSSFVHADWYVAPREAATSSGSGALGVIVCGQRHSGYGDHQGELT